QKYGGTYYAFVHNEGPCHAGGPTQYSNLSVSAWSSATGAPGSWSLMAVPGVSPGTIISSDEQPELSWLTGYGDGSVIPDDTGNWAYAYMAFYSDSSRSDYKNVIARAPMGQFGPGNWTFLYTGCWCKPALNNGFDVPSRLPQADLINWVGANNATMSSPGQVTPYKVLAVDGKNHAYNYPTSETYEGIALSVSLDYLSFTTLHMPLVNYDSQNYNGRPTPDDLYVYSILRND